jgi:hypothetical protein
MSHTHSSLLSLDPPTAATNLKNLHTIIRPASAIDPGHALPTPPMPITPRSGVGGVADPLECSPRTHGRWLTSGGERERRERERGQEGVGGREDSRSQTRAPPRAGRLIAPSHPAMAASPTLGSDARGLSLPHTHTHDHDALADPSPTPSGAMPIVIQNSPRRLDVDAHGGVPSGANYYYWQSRGKDRGLRSSSRAQFADPHSLIPPVTAPALLSGSPPPHLKILLPPAPTYAADPDFFSASIASTPEVRVL